MSGVVGVIGKTLGRDVKPVFEALLAPLRSGERLQSEVRVGADARWALGQVHLGLQQQLPEFAQEGPVQVLFHGQIDNTAELTEALHKQGLPLFRAGVVPLISALYQAYGSQFVARLKGAFSIVVLDERAKKLVLINDLLGSYFLYWADGPQHFVFASKLKAILRDPALTPRLNPRAVADYLTFGFLFGDKTLVEQVRLLPPASTLTYRWEERCCTLERYARLEDAFQPWEGTRVEYLDALRAAFNGAVQRALAGEYRFGIALSGGLDSRAILSAVACSHRPVSTYTLGVKGCADEVIAQKLAHLAGTQHQFFKLDRHYLGEYLTHLQHMVSLTDGMYLSHGLTEILALQCLRQADFSVLLRGHGGELAKASLAWPLHTDERIHRMRSHEEFAHYMLHRANYVSRGVALHELFVDAWWGKIEGGAYRSLQESIADVQLAPADLCSYLYLVEHHRRFTVASLELFRDILEVRLPFVDLDFLRVLFRGPALWRDRLDIHRAIISANHPALLRVRNSNTGAPASAGPVLEMVCDKMNSLFKRLNVYGYRHYHNFERWMRQMLITSVEQVLLHPESLARGIYREAKLRRMLEEAKQGHADHGYLFQILLILELWQRENLEGKASCRHFLQ
jgi:asparagine synthase (glutamine-hydrolysing)